MSDPIDGLTKEQTQEYNKYKKMEQFFGVPANVTLINTYTPMKNEVGEFKQNIIDVGDLLPKKSVDNKGITDEKDLRKLNVANYWFSNVLSKAKAYAFKVKNTELAVKVDFSQSEVEELRDGDVQPFCLGVKNVLSPLIGDAIFDTYGIDAPALTAGMTTADDFKAYIGKTKGANADKTVAGGNIGLEFTQLRENNNQFDLLIEHWKTLNPDFYNGYQAINVEDDIGIRHTGIEGNVTKKSDGTPLKDAVIKNLTKNKAVKSGLTGFYSLIKQMPGDCEIEVSLPGYKTIKVIVKMKRGKILDMDFQLENE